MQVLVMDKVNISVIVPVYNAEVYLINCLSSIQAQTFPSFEVWLINDGSTDHSGTICDQFAQKDSRFHVVHSSNKGVSSARNKGLEKANGEWICFIDSDDTVEKDYLSSLFSAVQDQENDILIIQGFNQFCPHNITTQRIFPNYLYEQKDFHLIFRDLKINRSGYPFGKLYNTQIIHKYNIRFLEHIHYAEDVMFMLTYMCHITKVQTLSGTSYNYYMRQTPDRLSQRIFSYKSEYACYQTYLSTIQTLKAKFNFPESSLQSAYEAIAEYLIRRSIGSMYQKQTRMDRTERLSILKGISPEQISFLNLYGKQISCLHRISISLLTKQYYYLCDLFNQFVALGRSLKTSKTWH